MASAARRPEGFVRSNRREGAITKRARSPLPGHLPLTVAEIRLCPSDAQTEVEPWSLGQVLAVVQSSESGVPESPVSAASGGAENTLLSVSRFGVRSCATIYSLRSRNCPHSFAPDRKEHTSELQSLR